MYYVRGKITREDDPMYNPANDRIMKDVRTAEDLAITLVRWTKLGREINGVHSYNPEPRPKLAAAVLNNYHPPRRTP